MTGTGVLRAVVPAATTALVLAGAVLSRPPAPWPHRRVLSGPVVSSSSTTTWSSARTVHFTVLQAALDTADDGDRVRVCAGLYREALTVDTSVTVQGDIGAVASVNCLDPDL